MRPIRLLPLLTVIAAVSLAGCGTSSELTAPEGTTEPAATSAAPGSTSSGPAGAEQYTMEQVAEHDDDQSCWTVINGEVYDVTSWVVRHPGGPDRIRGLCGQDGTRNFTGQHEGQEVPAGRLAEFKIGTLAD